MSLSKISSLCAAVVVFAVPGVAQASQAAGWRDIFAALKAWLFGLGSGSGSGAPQSAPELGGEGLFAVAVVLLAGVALIMDRRRRGRAQVRA